MKNRLLLTTLTLQIPSFPVADASYEIGLLHIWLWFNGAQSICKNKVWCWRFASSEVSLTSAPFVKHIFQSCALYLSHPVKVRKSDVFKSVNKIENFSWGFVSTFVWSLANTRANVSTWNCILVLCLKSNFNWHPLQIFVTISICEGHWQQ